MILDIIQRYAVFNNILNGCISNGLIAANSVSQTVFDALFI